MKTNPLKMLLPSNGKNEKRGVALITVLAMISLAVISVLSFFTLAVTEQRSSEAFVSGVRAQQVAEQAVNMVMTQIEKGTYHGIETTWASQPGAIRVWNPRDPGASGGGATRIYKLYSDDEMFASSAISIQNDFDDFSKQDWTTQSHKYVDLNEPVIRGRKVYYPIVDPAATILPEWPNTIGGGEAGLQRSGVEGFDINGETIKDRPVAEVMSALARQGIEAHAAFHGAGGLEHAVMPVQWIYQTADGTLGFLDAAPSISVSEYGGYIFNVLGTGNVPSKENPIVARFAFWADDESSKLNVNTHAGGFAMDMPRAGGQFDLIHFAANPAAAGEFQRYPGHPGSVHLSSVLAPGVADPAGQFAIAESMYTISPGAVAGGSRAGNQNIATTSDKTDFTQGMPRDNQPLYASASDIARSADWFEEGRFDRKRVKYPFVEYVGGSSARPMEGDDEGMADLISRSGFFLTAVSKSPEVNPFNLPKVSMWPIHARLADDPESEAFGTRFDQLILETSRVGNFYFSVMRESADDPVNDFRLRASSSGDDAGYSNEGIYDYLTSMMNLEVPGWVGQEIAERLNEGPVRQVPLADEQLALSMMDYIRSTNVYDDSLYTPDSYDRNAYAEQNQAGALSGRYPFTNPRISFRKGAGFPGFGQVVPMRHETSSGVTLQGYGRHHTIAGVHVIAIVAGKSHLADDSESVPGAGGIAITDDQNRGRRDRYPDSNGYTNYPPLPQNVRQVINEAQSKNRIPAEFDWVKSVNAKQPNNWNFQLPLNSRLAISGANAGRFSTYRDRILDDPKTRYDLDAGSPLFDLFGPAPADASEAQVRAYLAPLNDMRLDPGFTLVQAILGFDMATPAAGWNGLYPDFEVLIERNGSFAFTDRDGNPAEFMGFSGVFGGGITGDTNTTRLATNLGMMHNSWAARPSSPYLPFVELLNGRPLSDRNEYYFLSRKNPNDTSEFANYGSGRFTPIDRGYREVINASFANGTEEQRAAFCYDLVTLPFEVDDTRGLAFQGGDLTFSVLTPDGATQGSALTTTVSGDRRLIQEVEIEVEDFSSPTPIIEPYVAGNPQTVYFQDPNHYFERQVAYVIDYNGNRRPGSTLQGRLSLTRDPANRGINSQEELDALKDARFPRRAQQGRLGRVGISGLGGGFVGPGDVVRSIVPKSADLRVIANKAKIEAGDYFAPHRDYNDSSLRFAHSMQNSDGDPFFGFNSEEDGLLVGLPDVRVESPNFLYQNSTRPRENMSATASSRSELKFHNLYGDFDTSPGSAFADGGYINRPDEGNFTNLIPSEADERQVTLTDLGSEDVFPYFQSQNQSTGGGPSFFSPNRMIPGSGMFGSLPRTLDPDADELDAHWQTLLFRPERQSFHPFGGNASHPGGASGGKLPDHVLMELFWMPVVEPYAISSTLATSGKLNINYDIVPFSHIERSTAMWAAFKSESLLCVPNKWHASYKRWGGRGKGWHPRFNKFGGDLQGRRLRAMILEHRTLEQFRSYFRYGEVRLNGPGRDTDPLGQHIFKTPSQIAEIHLIPQEASERLSGASSAGGVESFTPETAADMHGSGSKNYWQAHALVGENSIERVYANLQNRLTTKSNVFRVHFRAQVISQGFRDAGQYGFFVPELDSIVGEYRGSSVVERYLPQGVLEDFDAESLTKGSPNFDEFAKQLSAAHRVRVIRHTRFAP